MLDLNGAQPQSQGETSSARSRHVQWRAVKAAVKGRETEILDRLGIDWRSPETHIRCPYPTHDDHHPSWRWDAEAGKARCSCDASASIFDVIMKIEGIDFPTAQVRAAELLGREDLIGGAAPAGLTLEEYAEAKHLPIDWLNKIGVGQKASYGPAQAPAIRTIYFREAGNFATASIRFRVNLNGDRKKRHFWRKGDKPCLYGAQWAASLQETGYAVIVEGESDAQTLWLHGFPALGLAGANTWNEERDAPLFAGVPVVYVVVEPDTGGTEMMKWLSRSALAPRARLIRLPPATKDPSALYLARPNDFRAAFAAAMEAALPLPATSAAAGEVVDLKAPYAIARRFADRNFTVNGSATLHRHRDTFYAWNGAAYPEEADTALRAQLYGFLDRCEWRDRNGELRPVKPNIKIVTNVLDGLRASVHLDQHIAAPTWLQGAARNGPPADEILACTSGLLHLPTLELLPHTPAFFTYNALDFAYRGDAAEPRQWLDFLAQLWPDDEASIGTLQEIFGLCLTADMRQQKAFLIVGPKRSGKGTIARVLMRLVGLDNTAAPTLAGLGIPFGLQPLIGKRLAIISDARLGRRADQAAIAERLLSITGEDVITVDRKHRSAWTGHLQARFLVLSNELPRLADVSGALASRFIVLTLIQSFYGKEDHGLAERLLAELPGILNWAIAGRRRLGERGYFVQPASAAEAVRDLEDLTSPMTVFLRERCQTGAGFSATVDDLFVSWCGWCERQKRNPGTKQSLGRDLRAALPWLKMRRSSTDAGERERAYEGIRIKPMPSGISIDGVDVN
jgi:putative DNA primase/helicase